MLDNASVAGGVAAGGEEVVPVPALESGQELTAIQAVDDGTSELSAVAVVQDLPEELPVPSILGFGPYECARLTATSQHVQGSRVTVFSQEADGEVILGDGEGEWPFQPVWVSPLTRGQFVAARYVLCEGSLDALVSPDSPAVEVLPEPDPLPKPGISPVIQGQRTVWVSNLTPGAFVTIWADSKVIGNDFTYSGSRQFRLSRAPIAGESLLVRQKLCSESEPSEPVEVLPCSSLSAPTVQPPSPGDSIIEILDQAPGSRIFVFDSARKELGDGWGPRLPLYRPLYSGETITVYQSLGGCESSRAVQLPVTCMAQRLLSDPSLNGRYLSVGEKSYTLEPSPGSSNTWTLKGIVKFPGESPEGGAVRIFGNNHPLVIFVHGSHWNATKDMDGSLGCIDGILGCVDQLIGQAHREIESFRGFDFALDSLARNGHIVVSIDQDSLSYACNFSATPWQRLDLLLAHLDAILANRIPDLDLSGRIDFSRIGLAGHSMGGEAVLLAAKSLAADGYARQGVHVGGVLLIAPAATILGSRQYLEREFTDAPPPRSPPCCRRRCGGPSRSRRLRRKPRRLEIADPYPWSGSQSVQQPVAVLRWIRSRTTIPRPDLPCGTGGDPEGYEPPVF